MEKLQQLLDEGVIDEVFNQLKTGKEAEVWLVSHHGEPVAAKIYKAREFRSFKNDAGYKEGRSVRNTRTQRAMDKGSKFGRASAEEAWKAMESDTMFNLHAAGVRVPKPVMFYEGVLLMEVIGDAEGRVAPRLVDAHIPKEQAEPMYVLLRQEIIKMLAQDYIHGDLSEFNILLGANGPVIIDFPQVITAAKNSQSEKYFQRDLGNMLRFFSSIDPAIAQKHASDGEEIWREYVRRDISPSFVPSGRKHHGPPQHGGRPHHRGGPPQHARGPGGGGPQHPQRGPGGGGPQQQRGPGGGGGPQHPQRGPGGGGGPQQQRGPGGGGGPSQQRGPGGGGGPSQQRGPGGGGGPQQQRGPGGGGPQQPRGGPQGQGGGRPGGPPRAPGPRVEVVFRGASPARPDSAGPSTGGHQKQSNGPRRRPPRRF